MIQSRSCVEFSSSSGRKLEKLARVIVEVIENDKGG